MALHGVLPRSQLVARRPLLDPIDRILEVLFGLIMVLTFTGSLSAAEAGRNEVRIMLIGALGCNIAWGIIDGLMYLAGCIAEKGESARTLRALRNAPDETTAHQLIVDALPPLVAQYMTPEEISTLGQRVRHSTAKDVRQPLNREDLLGALFVCILVILATFPVVVPFLLVDDAVRGLRISNGIAVTMLFFSGYHLGNISDTGAWRTGLCMVFIGAVVVAGTIALGG